MEGKMSLVKIQVRKNIHPRQIEFGDGVERSQPGALYFVPGVVKTITSDEYNWIEKHHKDFFKHLVVLPSDVSKTPARKNIVKSHNNKSESSTQNPVITSKKNSPKEDVKNEKKFDEKGK
jgi:hypothetical protein